MVVNNDGKSEHAFWKKIGSMSYQEYKIQKSFLPFPYYHHKTNAGFSFKWRAA